VAATSALLRAWLNGALLGALLLGDVAVYLDYGVRPALRVAVQHPVARHPHRRAVAGVPGELGPPLTGVQQRGLGLPGLDRVLRAEQVVRHGAHRRLRGPAVEPLRAGAPEADPPVEPAGEDRCVAQHLEKLAGAALAVADRVAHRGFGGEEPLAHGELCLGPVGQAPLRLGPAHQPHRPERRAQREADERGHEERQAEVDLRPDRKAFDGEKRQQPT
jgi:hypothetical protein